MEIGRIYITNWREYSSRQISVKVNRFLDGTIDGRKLRGKGVIDKLN